MDIPVTITQAKVPVAVVTPMGDIDHASYQQLISKASEVYAGGVKYIVLDLSNTKYMSSAGLVALRSIARLLGSGVQPNPDDGWGALHALGSEAEQGSTQGHLKLLNPQPQITKVLEMVGLNTFFEVYTDQDAAVASFPDS